MQACQPRYQWHQAANSLNSGKGLFDLDGCNSPPGNSFPLTTSEKSFLGSHDVMGISRGAGEKVPVRVVFFPAGGLFF